MKTQESNGAVALIKATDNATKAYTEFLNLKEYEPNSHPHQNLINVIGLLAFNKFDSIYFEAYYRDEDVNKSKICAADWMAITILFNRILFNGSLDVTAGVTKDNSIYHESATTEVNDKYKNIWITKLTEVTINSFYPELIISLNPTIQYNIVKFGEIFETVFNFYRSGFMKGTIMHTFLKIWINMAYGILVSANQGLYVINKDIASTVTGKARMIMNTIMKEFPGHYVYVQIDTVYFAYFEEIEKRFEKLMLRFDYLRYSIDIKSGVFFDKRNYITQKDHTLEMKGFKII